MNASLHLNLLKDAERFSSSPIRPRVMIPLLAILSAAGLGVWWMLLTVRLGNAVHEKMVREASCAELKPALNQVLELRAREKEAYAALAQLGFYRASIIRFGDTLMRLPQHVPESIQFTELRVPPPPPMPPPRPDDQGSATGPHQPCRSRHPAHRGTRQQQHLQRGRPIPAGCLAPAGLLQSDSQGRNPQRRVPAGQRSRPRIA